MAHKEQKTKDVGYTPPANPEAEQSVLGAILVRPEVLDHIADTLAPGDFYREAHGRIYQAMLGLYAHNEPVDLVTVSARLKDAGWLEGCGGPVFLASLSEQVGFATNADFYTQIVKEKAILRRLLSATQEIAGACLGPVDDINAFIDRAESKLFQATANNRGGQAYPLSDLVGPEVQRLEALYNRTQEIMGLPSGFMDIDRLTCGFQNQDLIIIAARPSMGKTAMALNIAHNAASKPRVPVAFFSMEMSKEQLVQRLMISEGLIDSYRLRSGKMHGQEWASLTRVSGELMDAPIFIMDKPAMTPLEIKAMARRLKAKHKIGIIIIDYLQLAEDSQARSREQEVSKISRAFKGMAKELDMPVIALAQLNRRLEERPNKRPILADLRDSGQIEQDADLVFFIYRDEVYNENSNDRGIAEVRLAKQRNGPTGLVKLVFRAEFMRFESLAAG